MNLIFDIVANLLVWFSDITRFTYNEINIIAYYILIPFIFFSLFDKIIRKHYLKSIHLLIVFFSILVIDNFSTFSDKLFKLSVDFLLSFNILGLNYIQSSVVICVIVPIIIIGLAIILIRRKKQHVANKSLKTELFGQKRPKNSA